VRAMNLPAMPVTAKSRDDCIKIYLKRLSANRACSAHTSMLLTSYLAWPNDEERRNSFAASFLARFERGGASDVDFNSSEFTTFGGAAAMADAALDHLSGEISTTLADLLTPLLVANPFSAMRAPLLWWLGDKFEDGLTHGGQCRLRWRPVDSFFPVLLF